MECMPCMSQLVCCAGLQQPAGALRARRDWAAVEVRRVFLRVVSVCVQHVETSPMSAFVNICLLQVHGRMRRCGDLLTMYGAWHCHAAPWSKLTLAEAPVAAQPDRARRQRCGVWNTARLTGWGCLAGVHRSLPVHTRSTRQ
jgi:hypothetical protein